MNLQVFSISDIEELIISKVQIEKQLFEKKEISQKSTIMEFIDKYGKLDNVYVYNDQIIPFNLVCINDNWYCFVANKEEINNRLKTILSDLSCDLSKLKRADNIALMSDSGEIEEYFIINGSNYIIPKK